MSKHFDGNLEDGELGEDSFGAVLKARGLYWEHKRDHFCSKTGNIAIEFETARLPNGEGEKHASGVAVTHTPGWWVVEFGASGIRLVLPVDTALRLARLAVQDKRARWIGDNNRFHNALVPAPWFWAIAAPHYTTAKMLAATADAWQGYTT